MLLLNDILLLFLPTTHHIPSPSQASNAIALKIEKSFPKILENQPFSHDPLNTLLPLPLSLPLTAPLADILGKENVCLPQKIKLVGIRQSAWGEMERGEVIINIGYVVEGGGAEMGRRRILSQKFVMKTGSSFVFKVDISEEPEEEEEEVEEEEEEFGVLEVVPLLSSKSAPLDESSSSSLSSLPSSRSPSPTPSSSLPSVIEGGNSAPYAKPKNDEISIFRTKSHGIEGGPGGAAGGGWFGAGEAGLRKSYGGGKKGSTIGIRREGRVREEIEGGKQRDQKEKKLDKEEQKKKEKEHEGGKEKENEKEQEQEQEQEQEEKQEQEQEEQKQEQEEEQEQEKGKEEQEQKQDNTKKHSSFLLILRVMKVTHNGLKRGGGGGGGLGKIHDERCSTCQGTGGGEVKEGGGEEREGEGELDNSCHHPWMCGREWPSGVFEGQLNVVLSVAGARGRGGGRQEDKWRRVSPKGDQRGKVGEGEKEGGEGKRGEGVKIKKAGEKGSVKTNEKFCVHLGLYGGEAGGAGCLSPLLSLN